MANRKRLKNLAEKSALLRFFSRIRKQKIELCSFLRVIVESDDKTVVLRPVPGNVPRLKGRPDGSFSIPRRGSEKQRVFPAGGNFDEPVTQATIKVVGAFHGLSRARSDARRYPAIDPLDSWSKYHSVCDTALVDKARAVLRQGNDINQMMKVVGEEGTSLSDFVIYLKSELIDMTYLQQNSFDAVDAATPDDRQRHVFGLLCEVLDAPMTFEDRDAARAFFHRLTQTMRDWNGSVWQSDAFAEGEKKIREMVASVAPKA